VRWMTAWDTSLDDVATFARGVELLTGRNSLLDAIDSPIDSA